MKTTYGQIRIPIKDTFVNATLHSTGWECEEPAIEEFLDLFHPPEFAAYLPAPWNRVLEQAAKETDGKVIATRQGHAEHGYN